MLIAYEAPSSAWARFVVASIEAGAPKRLSYTASNNLRSLKAAFVDIKAREEIAELRREGTNERHWLYIVRSLRISGQVRMRLESRKADAALCNFFADNQPDVGTATNRS
jgi:hypothetical protein